MLTLAAIFAQLGLILGLCAILGLLLLIHELEAAGHDIDDDRS